MYLKTIDDFENLILATIIIIFIVLIKNMQWTYSLSYMRSLMLIIFSQQILSDRLLLAVIDRRKKKVILVVSLN